MRMPEEDSRVLLYSFAEERRGYKIIEYEIYRYQVRHGIYADGQTSLRDIAFYNMEYHPEYFGPYPAPLATPRGRTARYKPLMNGIFWDRNRHRRGSPRCLLSYLELRLLRNRIKAIGADRRGCAGRN